MANGADLATVRTRADGARRGTTKAERGPEAIQSIRRHGAAYLVAVGGAAYLLSKAIRRARVLAFEDLGMEAIHEFELADFPPVTVAVDSRGTSIHRFAATQPASTGS